jgi:AhpD family alkylhydroperoxidase
MKGLKPILLVFSLALCAPAAMAGEQGELAPTHKDITATFGFVPSFLKHYPEQALPAAWEMMKSVQLNPSTAISPKLKELIGLAVAAQIPCRYCTYFHTEAGKLSGAKEKDMYEAVAIAANTRFWSTYLNGAQIEESTFRKDTDRIIEFLKDKKEKPAKEQMPIMVTDAQSAYKDMEQNLGRVPEFMRSYQENGIAAAWKSMKSVELNPETMLTGKEKELIGLAVSAQVPCRYCIYFHTEAAKLNGATDREIKESIAMASATRFWSTVLNGTQIDESTFRGEVRRVIDHLKKTSDGSPVATEETTTKKAKK